MEEEEKKRQKKDEKKIGRKKSALFLWETKESSRHFLVLSPLSLSHDFKAHHHLWDIAKEESDDDDDERQRREEGRCINTFSKEREKKKGTERHESSRSRRVTSAVKVHNRR
jgi:hypothetical protein